MNDMHVWDDYAQGWRIGTRPDGQAVWVHPLLFTFAIIVGNEGDPWYSDRWCYESLREATSAARAWVLTDDPEPDGWHRHPGSGRRREAGDRTTEYVEP